MNNLLNEVVVNKPSIKILALLLLMFTQVASADPFTECPSEAFLVQDKVARLYGVSLATGQYKEYTNDMGTTGGINGFGFNFHDSYLYGWSYQYKTLAKIGNDYQMTALELTGGEGLSFYVGDVSATENIYYGYRPGSNANAGLFAIPLDPQDPNYLEVTRIIDGSSLYLRIADMAFHPYNGFAYTVDFSGVLHIIDVTTGTVTTMNNVGVAGTFGAVYFDVDENLYISRNNDGHVFRIDTKVSEPQAELFVYGPSSSSNDGARCAFASVIPQDVATIDFGDAPASYGTSADDNGARHNVVDTTLYLGSSVDAEFDSHQFPLSDDEAGTGDDEDGVNFVTGLEVDSFALLQIEASEVGYVNAWIDFDGSGDFGDDEQILSAQYVAAGSNTVSYSVPAWAETGSTWARFRISSSQSIGPVGGVSDGEVEDYPVDITEPNVSISYYPSASDWATIAFEDNWPLIGDYDFTDMVMNYRLIEYRQNDAVIRVKIEGQIAAVGASYHNGFAFHLPGIPRAQIDESNIRYLINNKRQSASPLEADRDAAIIIVADDVWDYVTAGQNCLYHRTEPGCGSKIQMQYSMILPLTAPIDNLDMPAFPYDPFLFATEGYEHGYLFGEAPGRRYEIHLPGMAPTEAFQENFFNRGDDFSDPANKEYFVSEKGMPWAINVGTEWKYPLEYMDVIYAYPLFPSFIANEGKVDADWYLPENANLQNTFSN